MQVSPTVLRPSSGPCTEQTSSSGTAASAAGLLTVSPAVLPSFASAADSPAPPPPTERTGQSVVASIADALASSHASMPSAGRDAKPDQHLHRRAWTVDDADGELQTTLQQLGCDVVYRASLGRQTSCGDNLSSLLQRHAEERPDLVWINLYRAARTSAAALTRRPPRTSSVL